MRLKRLNERGAFGLDDLIIIIIIVVVVVVMALIVDDAINNSDCDFECQRAATCEDEAFVCHNSCVPDQTEQDCHNECNRDLEACRNLGPETGVSNLTTASGLAATTDKWQRYAGCCAARNGCRNRCDADAANTSIPRPTDPGFLDFIAKKESCYKTCEETFAKCESDTSSAGRPKPWGRIRTPREGRAR